MMDNIKEKYFTNRNIVVGTILFMITSYFGYKFIQKPPSTAIQFKEEKIIVPKEQSIVQKGPTNKEMNKYIRSEITGLFKTLTKEIKKTSRDVSSLNAKNLFKNDIEKHKLVINSKNITHTSSHNTSKYTVNFDNGNGGNNTGGYGRLINVIGFRLLKATIPTPPYNVTDNNNKIIVDYDGGEYTVTLVNGFYTGTELKSELVTRLNAHASMSGWSASYGAKTFKFTIANSTSFHFKWNTNYLTNNSHAYKSFGFKNINGTATTSVISDNASDLYVHFVDLIIPEIPGIACKRNTEGKNMIERIPITRQTEPFTTYMSHPTELMSQIYFYPISLNKLTIELYDDSTDQLFQSENMDNSFEFEITILKNTKLME